MKKLLSLSLVLILVFFSFTEYSFSEELIEHEKITYGKCWRKPLSIVVTIFIDYKKCKYFEKALDKFEMTEEEYYETEGFYHEIRPYMNKKIYKDFCYKLHNDIPGGNDSGSNIIVVTYNSFELFDKDKHVYNDLCEEEWVIRMSFTEHDYLFSYSYQ